MLFYPLISFLLYLFSAGTSAESSVISSGTTYRTLALPSVLVQPADNAEYSCTTSTNWVTTGWNPADCVGAIQEVQDLELVSRRNTVYEFIENGARQTSPSYYGQATPRSYVYNSCTLSVVMMNDTKVQTFRALPPNAKSYVKDNSTFAKSDFTTYQDIWYAFRQIYLLCASQYGVPGWITIGNDLSVGLFLHATDSVLDQRINGTEPNTTIAETRPTDWAYLGCNTGTVYGDSFFRSWGPGEGLSLGRCAEYCEGGEYFGVKNGSECFCGNNTFTSFAAVGGEMACNTTCNGNATEICGGVRSISVYQHFPGKPYIPTWGLNNG